MEIAGIWTLHCHIAWHLAVGESRVRSARMAQMLKVGCTLCRPFDDCNLAAESDRAVTDSCYHDRSVQLRYPDRILSEVLI